jgi:hypothetical protein
MPSLVSSSGPLAESTAVSLSVPWTGEKFAFADAAMGQIIPFSGLIVAARAQAGASPLKAVRGGQGRAWF